MYFFYAGKTTTSPLWEANKSGLEVLALRRSYQGRRQGSLMDLLGVTETAIRQGKMNLASVLNLGKKNEQVAKRSSERMVEIEDRKALARVNLKQRINASPWIWEVWEEHPTGLFVTPEDLLCLKGDGQLQRGESAPVPTRYNV